MTRTTLKLKPTSKEAPKAAPKTTAVAATRATSAPTRPAGTLKPKPKPARPTSSPVSRSRAAPKPLPDTGERLSKKVMQIKGCSRKEAEQYIEGGWVQVNGVVIEEPQHRVARETITLDPNASLMELTPVTLLLNKPAGHTDGLEDLPPPRAGTPSRPGARARKAPPANARALLIPAHHWADDPTDTRVLKRHFNHLEADVELETGATGLVVFTQDWRTTRKLTEDMATMEHEFLVEVKGEVGPDSLKPIGYALKDERLDLPQAKVSVNSTTPQSSRLRFAIKGSHPGLIAFLCEKAGLQILAMKRIRLGRVALSDLPVGQWRYLAGWEKF
ncbi:MAG: RNA pseudouridine synthase [Rhodoferax sp.]|nr:RNA pseudouridine synthase [Rhodoferax sp.]